MARECAFAEAGLATRLGYDAGLLSLAAVKELGLDALVSHCAEVALYTGNDDSIVVDLLTTWEFQPVARAGGGA